MKSKNQLQVLQGFIKSLESHGCIISHRGRLELPFKATAANLALSAEATHAKNITKLERWIRQQSLVISAGVIGVTKNIVLKSGNVKICKLVRTKDGGWQFKPTSNWEPVKQVQHWPKRRSGGIQLLPRRQRMSMH